MPVGSVAIDSPSPKNDPFTFSPVQFRLPVSRMLAVEEGTPLLNMESP